MSNEIKILEIALQKISSAMDELINDCLDESGKPKSPSMQVLMRSRGLLPPYCKQSLSKKTNPKNK